MEILSRKISKKTDAEIHKIGDRIERLVLRVKIAYGRDVVTILDGEDVDSLRELFKAMEDDDG